MTASLDMELDELKAMGGKAHSSFVQKGGEDMGKRVISAILTLKDKDFSSNLKRASERTDDFGRGVTLVGNHVQRFSQKAVGAFKAVGAGAAALGATGLAAIGVGVAKSIVDTDAAFSRLEARTGATGAKLEELKTTAKDVFKAGFGENMDQVANDVSTLGAMFSNLKGDALTEVAKGAATISETWDAESKEVGKTVKSMTSNFKGLSETKALDLMTHAFQKRAITQMIYLILLTSIACISRR